jgi:hypothetical protein
MHNVEAACVTRNLASPADSSRGMTAVWWRGRAAGVRLLAPTLRGSRVDARVGHGHFASPASRSLSQFTTTMEQTTLEEWAKDPVDPETRAHVYSLITAVSIP